MNPVIFEVNGPLPDSKYLLGGYRWSGAMRLTNALLTCRPPSSGTLTLILELGGFLTSTTFTVGASSQPEITQRQALNVLVPPNTRVRWKAVFSEAPSDAAACASITIHMVPDNGALTKPALTVAWVNGPERLTLFSYEALAHRFIPLPAANGRATITNQSPEMALTISIQNTTALLVSSLTLYLNELQATGATATPESPRLEFQIDGVRIATLTKSGTLLVPQVTEETPAPLISSDPDFYNRFAFYSEGTLTAVLTINGLSALNFEQPLPL